MFRRQMFEIILFASMSACIKQGRWHLNKEQQNNANTSHGTIAFLLLQNSKVGTIRYHYQTDHRVV